MITAGICPSIAVLEPEAAEIRDTIEAYEYLAGFDEEARAPTAAQNHADHMAYKRDQVAKEAWRS